MVIHRGKEVPGSLAVQMRLAVDIVEPGAVDNLDPRRIRKDLGFSAVKMALFLGVPYHTYRSWEEENPKYRKKPSGAARTLLKICLLRPDVIKEVMDLTGT